jgi:hypothetical protein
MGYARGTIIQIVDQRTALVDVANQTLFLRGIETAGLVDGSDLFLPTAILIGQPVTYKTVLGANRTVYSATPFDLEAFIGTYKISIPKTPVPPAPTNTNTASSNSAAQQQKSPVSPAPTNANKTSSGPRAKRPERWILNFQSSTPDEFAKMLESLGFEIAIPLAGSTDTWLYYPHPASAPGTTVQKKLSGETRLYWIDETPERIRGVAGLLKMQPQPHFLVYFISSELEDRMLQEELAFGSRAENEITRTTFEVSGQGSGYAVSVKNQDPPPPGGRNSKR